MANQASQRFGVKCRRDIPADTAFFRPFVVRVSCELQNRRTHQLSLLFSAALRAWHAPEQCLPACCWRSPRPGGRNFETHCCGPHLTEINQRNNAKTTISDFNHNTDINQSIPFALQTHAQSIQIKPKRKRNHAPFTQQQHARNYQLHQPGVRSLVDRNERRWIRFHIHQR